MPKFVFKDKVFKMSGEGFGSVTMWGFSPSIDLQSSKFPYVLNVA